MLELVSPAAVAVTLSIDGDDELFITPRLFAPPVAVAVTLSIENDPLVTPFVYKPKLNPPPPPVLLMVR